MLKGDHAIVHAVHVGAGARNRVGAVFWQADPDTSPFRGMDVGLRFQPTMAENTSATIKQVVQDIVSQDDVASKLKQCIAELLANGQDPREHPNALKQKLRDLVTGARESMVSEAD